MRTRLSAALACALLAAPAAADTAGGATDRWPTLTEVKATHPPSEAWLLDRHGESLQRFRVDSQQRRFDWVPLADLSPAMRAALLAAEDRRFYEHRGVDWRAFAAAAWRNLLRDEGRRPTGASTLTMQLAGMLDPALAAGAGGRTLGQKWEQTQAALALERQWPKDDILEAYINLASFRGEVAGIGTAAATLFGKHPSGLDGDEAAILAALLRAPAAGAARVAGRACQVADAEPGSARCIAIGDAVQRALMTRRARYGDDPGLAPQLRRLAGPAGSRTRVSLDRRVQQFATDALIDQLAQLVGREVSDGAVVVLDNRSGEVLAAVGRQSADASVDPAVARRQAGSTLKPFLYALAIEQRLITAATPLDDSPLAIATAGGLYLPQNYDRDFKGPVSARTALAASLNVPAVRVLTLVGVEAFRERLTAFGFTTLAEAGAFYGPALALGAPEVTLLELANAYRALANGGRHSPVRWLAAAGESAGGPAAAPSASGKPVSVPSPGVRVLGRDAAFVVTDVLADRGARALTFGFDNALATRSWSAVKTGTSKDLRDNWCVGFSERYTVGVWVGNADGRPMRDVSGVSGAAPVWQAVMEALHAVQPSSPPRPPPGLVRATADGGSEWFLAGTAPPLAIVTTAVTTTATATAAAPRPEIISPAEGSVLAIDPDIPPRFQRVALAARGEPPGAAWRVDGVLLPDALWPPTPGRHRIELLDADGVTLAERRVLVRGNSVAVAR